MKKLLFGAILLTLVSGFPIMTMAAVNINIGIALPPPIVFTAPPEVIVLPDTNEVYVDPDVDVDLFFWDGWWWRLWEGRWYRSYYYDRGWAYYSSVPIFYFDIDPGWRGYYREHRWYGHPWHYERIPHRRLQQNWRTWYNDRHWEGQRTWGVEGYHPRPQQQRQEVRRQRQAEYQQRPEVQRHQREEQQRRSQVRKPQVQQPRQQPQVQQPRQQPQVQQPRHPQVQQPRQQPQERVQRPQRQEQRPQVQQPQRQEQRPQAQQPQHSQPQGRPDGGEGEYRR